MTETEREDHTQDNTARQAELFGNRLKKRYKHLRKWAARADAGCWRLYDKDIPEIPLAVDVYTDSSSSHDTFLTIALYERPYDKPEDEEEAWLAAMVRTAAEVLSIPPSQVYSRVRKRQRGIAQYEKSSASEKNIIVREQGLLFNVNLSDYLDTGLFFDHRLTRAMVRAEASGKRVLNLFCYTGSFSVYAAAGGALTVDSVDLSSTYLTRAAANCTLNGFTGTNSCRFVRQDVKAFLSAALSRLESGNAGPKWDIIILDPPTFSNSKRAETPLDVNREWPSLVNACLRLLTPDGVLYFSSNSRKLRFDAAELLLGFTADDITEKTIPEDFRNKKIHVCWRIFNAKI